MEDDLTAAALAWPALTDLIGARLSWDERPQGEELPALRLQIVSGPPQYNHGGRIQPQEYLVQFDCLAATPEEAKGLKLAVVGLLESLTAAPFAGGFVENQSTGAERTDGPTPTGADTLGASTTFRQQVDGRVWHRDA